LVAVKKTSNVRRRAMIRVQFLLAIVADMVMLLVTRLRKPEWGRANGMPEEYQP
jgi:hypothetical protein